MEYRPLNITVISAEGLKDVNLFSKMDLYAVVSIQGYEQSKKKTFVDKDCGTHPKWNHRVEIIVDEPYLTKPGLSILFQIKAEGTIGSDKEVGSVTVPLDDLYKNNPSGDKVVDYQVRTSSGKSKGSLKISYSFGEKFTHQLEAKKHIEEPMMAYPAPPQQPYGAGPSYPAAAQPYPGMGYPPQYPPASGYPGYPPQGPYGYQAPPQGYGYPPAYGAYPPGQNPKKNKMGMGGMGGMGMGLGAGLLGGLLVGEMVSDIGDASAYADGYSDAMGDMGDF